MPSKKKLGSGAPVASPVSPDNADESVARAIAAQTEALKALAVKVDICCGDGHRKRQYYHGDIALDPDPKHPGQLLFLLNGETYTEKELIDAKARLKFVFELSGRPPADVDAAVSADMQDHINLQFLPKLASFLENSAKGGKYAMFKATCCTKPS